MFGLLSVFGFSSLPLDPIIISSLEFAFPSSFSVAHLSEPVLNLVGYDDAGTITVSVNWIKIITNQQLYIRHSPRQWVAQVFSPSFNPLLISKAPLLSRKNKWFRDRILCLCSALDIITITNSRPGPKTTSSLNPPDFTVPYTK